jgi:aryl-phospho-beta-D-glucosidase BglC (GH1 family)
MRKFQGYTKGINLGGWLSQCLHLKLHYDLFISERDIETIKSWGLDHIRLPIDHELVETEDGNYKENGFLYIDKVIKWCGKYGLNLILDLHKTAGYSFAEQGSGSLFVDKQLQDRFISLWKEFAKRYGQYHDSVAFELLNEVVSPDVTNKWNEIVRNTVSAIRLIAPDTYIIIGGVRYNHVSCVKSLDKPYDDKIVYNFHCYEPMVFTHQKAKWMKQIPKNFEISYPYDLKNYRTATAEIFSENAATVFDDKRLKELNSLFFELLFEEAVSVAEERNVPLYCGEYGVIDTTDTASTLNWFRDINCAFEKYSIGRAVWSYKKMNYGISDDHYKPIFNDLIKVL